MRKVMTLLLVLSLGAAAACGDDEPSSSPSSTTPGPQRSVLEAVEVWVVEHRDTVFPGFEGEFAGACEEGVLNVLCTIPREDLGIRTIVGVGAASSDWGADLLLQRGDEGWTSVDFWAWDLESDALGPPFPPLTAIAEWWSTFDPNAVFVRDCDDISAATTAEELVCAVLESDGDEVRQYRTGRPPTVDAHQVEVHHQPDHSWVVVG